MLPCAQIKSAVVDLFASLPEADQRALLEGKDSSAASSVTNSNGKGKGKPKTEKSADGEQGDEDVKPDVKGKGKKKDLTEEDKAAAEVSLLVALAIFSRVFLLSVE